MVNPFLKFFSENTYIIYNFFFVVVYDVFISALLIKFTLAVAIFFFRLSFWQEMMDRVWLWNPWNFLFMWCHFWRNYFSISTTFPWARKQFTSPFRYIFPTYIRPDIYLPLDPSPLFNDGQILLTSHFIASNFHHPVYCFSYADQGQRPTSSGPRAIFLDLISIDTCEISLL